VSDLVIAFARLRQTNPERRLIHQPSTSRVYSVEDIWQEHLEYAALFRSSGLRAGQLLLLSAGNHPAIVAVWLAARALDLTILPVDTGTTGAEIRELCERFDVAALVTASVSEQHLAGRWRPIPGGLGLITRSVDGCRYSGTAVLKLTSGSTGLPKATCTSESQLVVDSQQILAGMKIAPADTQIAAIPLSHAYGISVILVPLIFQGSAMVLRESFVPHQLHMDVGAFGATTFPGVPFMFEYFLANPPAEGWPRGLHRLISAGARLPATTVRRFFDQFGVKIHSFYGASESGGISYDDSPTVDDAETVGRPLPGVTVAFRHDESAPSGSGRVHVKSRAVSTGYLDESGGAFCDGGFLTGDCGLFDDRGRLRLTGRVSTFINVAGKKVQPAEVEDVLRQMPGVRDVRVVAAVDPQRGEQVVACLAVDQTSDLTTLAVRRFCSARLAPHKIPRAVVFLDAIPLTARGKTDRRALDEAIRARIAGIPEQLC
jgi:acyl-CoA synthetase (AMP-forming)/AMP-acid ligase II